MVSVSGVSGVSVFDLAPIDLARELAGDINLIQYVVGTYGNRKLWDYLQILFEVTGQTDWKVCLAMRPSQIARARYKLSSLSG